MNERPTYQEALLRTCLLRILEQFDPHVVGTLPLGVAGSDSDIDIVCYAADLSAAAGLIWKHLDETESFAAYQWSAKGRPVIATLEAYGWPFEIFVSPTPVSDQADWRHFQDEKRLAGMAWVRLPHGHLRGACQGSEDGACLCAFFSLKAILMWSCTIYSAPLMTS